MSADAFTLINAYSAAQTKTKGLETQLEAAEDAEAPDQAAIEALKGRATAAKTDENTTLASLQSCLAALDIMESSSEPATTDNLSSVSAKPTTRLTAWMVPPKEYKHDEDFRAWSKRFQRYLSVGNLGRKDALLLMLNCVDDRTAQRLETVVDSMEDKVKCDYTKFIPLCEEAIYPKSESRALRLELTQLVQTADEDIGSFAARIRNIASRAYDGQAPGKDDCCYQTFVRGIRNRDIKLDVMKSEIDSFENAVLAATKLERIISSTETAASETGHLDVLRVRETRNNGNNQPTHTVQSSREHHGRERGNSERHSNQSSHRDGNRDTYRRPDTRPANGRYEETRTCWSCGVQGHLQRFCDRRQSNDYRPSNLNMRGAGGLDHQSGRENEQ